MTSFRSKRRLLAAAVLAAAACLPAHAEQTGDAVTISWSGATFMRSFTTSRGISLLNPGSCITLNSGPGGTPIVYCAQAGNTTSVQLAANNANGVITPNPNPGDPAVNSANYLAIRFEWHEQGSVEGILEMINDQIGAVNSVGLLNRNGNAGNPTWVNSNPFGQNNGNVVPAPPPFGAATPGVDSVTVNGFTLKASTYNTMTGYDDSVAARPGRNTQGGQNRVQQAVSDVNARQGFAKPGTSAWNRIPGQAGYGKGNQGLSLAAPGDLQGVGASGVRHEFAEDSIINMTTSNTDPTTGAAFPAGPWNTAGVDNLQNIVVAVGGMGYTANPGTGLERINRSDNVWLHSTGRLQNGADFNVVSRDAYSGTINSATNNIGLDTSWATGENDDGNTNAANGVAQTRIGPDYRNSGKTSGGQGVRPTVQNSRMGFGHLSSSDAIPSAKNSASRPLRVLDYRDDDNDLTDGSNNLLPPELRNNRAYPDPITGSDATLDIINGFTRLSAKSIVEGSYASRTNQTYVSIKKPSVAFASDTPAQWAARTDAVTGIKGDNSGNDVYEFRQNILTSVANFPASSVANPGDQLLALSFMLPQFAKMTKDLDGLNRDVPNPIYDAGLSATFLGSATLTAPFNPAAPSTITTGSGSTYGNSNIGTGSAAPGGGSIPINAANYLFGDFDQRTPGVGISGKGVRDYSDLSVAQRALDALQNPSINPGLGNDWNVGAGTNATAVSGLPAEMNGAFTKGDLIVMGDFNSDGIFNGRDLYLMGRGTALADNTGSNILTGSFADAVRKGVLRKNAALDWLQTNATGQQKIDASSDGGLEFIKEDVNRDGKTNLVDAFTTDKFFGKDYRNLQNQLDATITVGGVSKPISLVNVELNDTGDITQGDLDPINNNRLTLAGNESWSGVTQKTGGGHIIFARPSGTITVAPGSSFEILAGAFSAGGAIDPFTDSATPSRHLSIVNNGGLNITAGSKHVTSISGTGATSVSAGATLDVGSSGPVTQASFTVLGSADVGDVTVTGTTSVGNGVATASLTAANVRSAALSIADHGSVHIKPSGTDSSTSVVNTLTFAGGTDAWLGSMDLADNDLIINATAGTRVAALANVTNQIKQARNSELARWTGLGLTSSVAPTNDLTGLAVLLNEDGGNPIYTSFSGQAVTVNSVLVKYTWNGDMDLNGKVDADDYFRIDSGFSAEASGYRNGDLDYSGDIDADDYFLIDSAFSGQSGELGGAAAIAAVPEPGMLSLAAVAAIGLLRRRRQRVV